LFFVFQNAETIEKLNESGELRRILKPFKVSNEVNADSQFSAFIFLLNTDILHQGFPTFFSMATHLTKPPQFRDNPLTVRSPPPPSTRLEKKIHNYTIKTNKANLTARFSYLIISKAEFRLMTSDFKT
jgi:hypothetical protein